MKVNEIFYSIQGEGAHTGTPAVFIRFSGCNLKCDFCDTNHQGGQMYTEEEIVQEVAKYPAYWVVVTGGEPALQLTQSLVDKIKQLGISVAVETNGTRELPKVDWITVSPKEAFVGDAGKPILKFANEVKVVYDGIRPVSSYGIKATHYYLQPCDTGDEKRNQEIINEVVQYVKENPTWKLSLQTQKILNVR